MASKDCEYVFLEEVSDNLKCCICQEVAKGMPKQHGDAGCGKLFCEECIGRNGEKPCPMCRGKNPVYFQDIRSLRDIKDLRVCCSNSASCSWEGTVASLPEHTRVCDYASVSCPNRCKREGKYLLLARGDVTGHLAECPHRLCKCRYCGIEMPFATLAEVHGDQCSMKVIQCPNKSCDHSAERRRIDEHVREDCQYAVVLCRYHVIGCTKRGPRKHMGKHEQDSEVHFPLSLQKIIRMDHELTSLKEEVSELKRSMRDFSTTSTRLNEATDLLKVETVTVSTELGALSGEVSEMKKDVESLQSDTAVLQMDVDRLFKKVTTLVTVRGFRMLRRQNEPYLSDSFYTAPSGYSMLLAIYPNGYRNDGSHVSVHIRMGEVAYQGRLHWPFKGNVKVELLNQLASRGKMGEKNHLTFIDSLSVEPNGGWLCQNFASHSELNFDPVTRTQYLLDDTLLFRVTVQEDF